jgi:uncharacterized protein (UPF0332 family)
VDHPCDDQIDRLMALARQALVTARHVLRSGDLRAAASRAYYACFYAASALLEARGITPRKHSGVISLIGLHFGKTREIEPELASALAHAFKLRQIADYEPLADLAPEQAESQIAVAERFIRAAEDWLPARRA